MKKVKITYEDGREETYATIRKAADALRCNVRAVPMMAAGASLATKRVLRIASISIGESKGRCKGIRHAGRKCKLVCTSETGEIVEAESISDAYKKLKYKHYINSIIDDNEFHWGWRFDSVDTDIHEEKIEFVNDVPEYLLTKIYHYARHYLRVYYGIPQVEREEMVQYIATHAASDYSCGRYNENFNLLPWLYLQVRHWGSRCVRKFLKRKAIFTEQADEELDNETWLELLAGGKEDQHEKLLIDEMPEELKTLARMLLEGRSRIEINVALKVHDFERITLMKKLGAWLLKRRRL